MNSFCIQLSCLSCKLTYHGKCINVTRSDAAAYNNAWLCKNCLDEALPFHHIEEDSDFIDIISDNIFQSPCLFSGFDQMIFNPFEINDSIETPLTDCDPDYMFYSDAQYIQNTDCEYYLEDKFISHRRNFRVV